MCVQGLITGNLEEPGTERDPFLQPYLWTNNLQTFTGNLEEM